ncbi:MAG: GGDEF domain-containing protein [Selenomonadaceae bacterium]|nr:GGDEF domain-containing protein [Selenomonadaceae bacterium]
MELKKFRIRSLIFYVVYMVIFYTIVNFEIEPFKSYEDFVGLIGNLICFPMFYYGLKCHDSEHQKAWKWMALSAFIYLIGEAIWAYNENILGSAPISPSICDLFYFLNTLTCLIGMFLYVRQIQSINPLNMAFDIVISVFAVGGIIYNFVILSLPPEDTESFLMLFIDLYNPIMDVVLLICLLIMLFGTKNTKLFTKPNLILVFAFILNFAMDQVSLLEKTFNWTFEAIMIPLWSTFYFMVAFTSTYSDNEICIVQSNESLLNDLLEYWKILLPYLFAFVILFILVSEYMLISPLFLWAIILVMLLSMRQIFILISNQQLMMRIRSNEEKLNAQNLELQKLNARVSHDAEIDFLTQLSNRRHIDQKIEKLISSRSKVEKLGILLIDVDFFKRINDTFGHQVGDDVLQKVAAAIRASIRNSDDIAGRFGGDEFIALLPNASTAETEAVTKKLVDLVHSDEYLRDKGVTLSIGCSSTYIKHGKFNVNNILKKTDDALYTAKENGRNQYVVG